MEKTKWQQLMDAPKGSVEYNPTQSFALQVFWVVRSPTAATEMIQKGFNPCANATMRDTPTTLAYIFRISRDQRLAAKLKSEVKTIGDHPHYQPAFKSIQMGIPRGGTELKLKTGGIDLNPLSWSPEEPITGHEKELDFDPVVLECTEIYLDDKSFYEHAASRDWMKYSVEILKPARSLKPKTFCVGHPSKVIWDSVLDSTLKAIRFEDDEKLVDVVKPGVFFTNFSDNKQGDQVFFLELDMVIHSKKIESCRSHLSSVQHELLAPFMIVLPTNLDDIKQNDPIEIRVMLSFSHSANKNSPSLGSLAEDCDKLEGRIITFDSKCQKSEDTTQRNEHAKQFLDSSGLSAINFSILDSSKAEQKGILAGYPLHPLYNQLISKP